MPDFLPVVREPCRDTGAARVEIAISGAALRVSPGTDPAFLGDIIRVVKQCRC
jgi:hypothetical protein